jgi:hypothetical protein
MFASLALAMALSVGARPASPSRAPLRHITPAVVQQARSFLALPMGDERYLDVDGVALVFVVEPHFHPLGYKEGPQGWHKGVTVYEVR